MNEHNDQNPYQPPAGDYGPFPPGAEVAPQVPGSMDPRARRSMILGIVAACLYFLPPVSIVLGFMALSGSRRFMNDWYDDPQLRGKGAAIAGKATGIGSIVVAIFMLLYYLFIFLSISSARSSSPY